MQQQGSRNCPLNHINDTDMEAIQKRIVLYNGYSAQHEQEVSEVQQNSNRKKLIEVSVKHILYKPCSQKVVGIILI